MFTHAFTIATGVMAGSPAGILDLALTDVSVVGVAREADYWKIEFRFTVENVGEVGFDPEGLNHDTDQDDAGIQTYLWDHADGMFFAASGWTFDDAPFIDPGESFTGRFTANTAQLPVPSEFGMNTWLVVDLFGTGEEPERMGNNRAIVAIPTPGAIGLFGMGVVVAGRRRRG